MAAPGEIRVRSGTWRRSSRHMRSRHWPLFGLRLSRPAANCACPRSRTWTRSLTWGSRAATTRGTCRSACCGPTSRRGGWRWRCSSTAGARGAPGNRTTRLELACSATWSAPRACTAGTSPWSPPARGWAGGSRAGASAPGCARRSATPPSPRSPRTPADNAASLAVQARLPAGRAPEAPRRGACLLVDRESWERHRTVPVEIHGLEPCLPLFGLQDGGGFPPAPSRTPARGPASANL